MPRLPDSDWWLTLTPRAGDAPAHRWLASALRDAVLDGRLRPGARLPPTRDLARRCRLSRGTVVAAFEQMKAEGYVSGRTGSGTYVNAALPDALLQVPRRVPRQIARPADALRARTLSDAAPRFREFPPTSIEPPRAFRANLPAVDLFPTTLWAQIAGRRLRRATAGMLRGCGALGYLPFREAIADYLAVSRGVACSADQVAVVSGVQEALDLVARLCLNPGDRVCMEDPGYIGAAFAFEGAGAAIVGLPVDAEGMTLPKAGARPVRLAYVTPAHQFPLGVSMSLPRRLALLEWARRTGAMIVEDDYDSEYRYTGAPLPALQGLDRHGTVLFAGSFSKVLFPSIRLGYLVVPPDLVDRVAALKSTTSRYVPVLDQAVLCDFIVDGHFGRHLRRMRQVYADRLGVLLRGARQWLRGLVDISGVEAGLQTTGWLCGIDEASAVSAAARRRVEVVALGRYSRRGRTREGLLLGFAAVDGRELQRGVRDLAAALERCRSASAPRRGPQTDR